MAPGASPGAFSDHPEAHDAKHAGFDPSNKYSWMRFWIFVGVEGPAMHGITLAPGRRSLLHSCTEHEGTSCRAAAEHLEIAEPTKSKCHGHWAGLIFLLRSLLGLMFPVSIASDPQKLRKSAPAAIST